MNIVQKNVNDLIPYAKNTKKHDRKQIANVAESIRQYGFVQPVVIDRDGVIVIGHCRVLGAKKLGMKEVPCVCVDDLTPEQVNALRVVDNKSNESDWDFNFLADELLEIDLSAFDFDFGIDLEQEKQEVVEDNFEAEPPEEPKAKMGDVWQLGRHRLMCGDSTSIDDVEKLMGGVKADMVFTDPPYGYNYQSKNIGDSCLDLFGGSGSTLIACEQLKRSCYMMEFDPKYVDVIISRWEQFTGEKAVLLND